MKKTSIFLVDDHTVVRKGLKELIEHMGDYEVIHEFANGQELVDAYPFAIQPDLIMLDLTMPVMNGEQTAQWINANKLPYPVLILTLDTSDDSIIQLFRVGVRGYLPKSCTADTLKKAIDDILSGGYYHNEFMKIALENDITKAKESERQKVLNRLTEREMLFLQLVCDEQEYTYEQMSDILKVHRRTIDGYRESLFEKFNIKSKTGIVLFAIKYGIVNLPPV